MHVPVQAIDREIWRDGVASEGARLIPEETPLALTYNGGTYAVMMGTPQNLEDFCGRLQPGRRHHQVGR
ncbi:formate dehydrogenase assembly factor FdhD [Bradyrhizobium japonicum]